MPSVPALAPDLVVARQLDGRWLVRQISQGLAEHLGLTTASALGRDLSRLLAQSAPPLHELVDEAQVRERKLTGVPLRLPEAGVTCLADIVPGGLGADYREPLVQVRLRAASARELESVKEAVSGLVGSSPGMREVYRKIGLYAASDAAVLVTGETGTGKELVARALHQGGLRRDKSFVAVNCSAISPELLESELFGHEKGAFTGAHREHRGRFERAHGGTIFLDEIGDMPRRAQSKLLRVLETGLIERVGAEREIPINVRVVGATNVPLESAVGLGQFRSDLYHRIAVLRIHLPPLRQRLDDLPLLVEHFLGQFRRQYQRPIRRLTPEAMTLLASYLWPGNIRELRNVLERVFIETQADVIGARAFAEWIHERQDFSPGDWGVHSGVPASVEPVVPPWVVGSEPSPVVDVSAHTLSRRPSTRPRHLTVEAIRSALQRTDGNLAAAARLLGVHRATLYRYMKKHGLPR
jgi:DNA-binding NtrC family response regulator